MVSKDDKKKLKAIQMLVQNGSRESEWQEAGLLCVIERVLNEDDLDLSAEGLQTLMIEAAKNR